MSIFPTLSIARFNDYLRMVYKPSPEHGQGDQWQNINLRRQVIRSFETFGFCEFDYSGRRLHMCPPTFILLPTAGTPCALFTGARVPETARRLREAVLQAGSHARLVKQAQSIGSVDMPARIIVEAVDKETLAAIAQEAGIDCDLDEPAAWKFVNLSLSITQINSRLVFEPRQEPNWARKIFREDQLKFNMMVAQPADIWWLAEYLNPVDKQRRHWLWRDTAAAEVSRDWGRHVTLAEKGRSVLLYDDQSCAFAVPATTPLPALLSRAAALSSGIQPDIRTTKGRVASIPAEHPILLFPDVPCAIVEMIASKLNQKLVQVDMQEILHKGNRND